MKKLPVYERFHSWQGEGAHAGRSAWFIRLFGCPVHCPWCDSAGTWHPDHIPAKIQRFSPHNLAEEAAAAHPAFVVITGGEPAVHDLCELTRALHRQKLAVHLETSGAFALQGDFDWITISPKQWKPPLEAVLQQADELKIIVDSPDAIDRWWQQLQHTIRTQTVWLHPEWSVRGEPEILSAISQAVMQPNSPFRAGWQLHKLYGVD